MENEGIHKVVKDALMIAEKEATRRSSSAAISDRDSMMMMEELEESC